jgi:hydroxypyruvate isomerase
MKRKEALKTISAGTALVSLGWPVLSMDQIENTMISKLKGNINHAVCRWCYDDIPLPDLCKTAKKLGIRGIDLLGPNDWDVVLEQGLTCSMSTALNFGITEGFNDLKLHEALYKNYEQLIPLAADKGINNIICFSGNRHGITDEQGLENCAVGLKKVVDLAKQYKVLIVMELLNSKVDHPDYQCDRTEWGVALCNKVGSEHFKLLYDVYHMQIMEGDVIATIRRYHKYIGHYHTGGVPGRHEINETQELYYPAIMKAIAETGFDGFVAQEFVPVRKDPMVSLEEGIRICDV